MSKKLLEEGLYAIGFFIRCSKGEIESDYKLQVNTKQQFDEAIKIFDKVGKGEMYESIS